MSFWTQRARSLGCDHRVGLVQEGNEGIMAINLSSFQHLQLVRRWWIGWLVLALGCGSRTVLNGVSGSEPSAHAATETGTGGLTGNGANTGGAPTDWGSSRGGNTGAGEQSGGAAASLPTDACTMDEDHPGYLNCGPWHGYAWTLATDTDEGSTISPSDFSSAVDLPLCANGLLASANQAVGLLGFYVHQDLKDDGTSWPDTWAVTGTGIRYEVRNPGGAPLRIQIQGANGYPSETWCANIAGSRGEVAWSTFNSMCWDESGPPGFNGNTPLEQVMLLVPGTTSKQQTFDFCLVSLYPY
jgi:hypothetical protein